MATLTPLTPSPSPSPAYAKHNLNPKNKSYHDYLDALIRKIGLSEQNWNHEGWADLARLTTQPVLCDIYSKKEVVVKLLSLIEPGEKAHRPTLSRSPDIPALDQMYQMIKHDSQLSKLSCNEALSKLNEKYSPLPFTSRERPKNCTRVQEKLKEQIEISDLRWEPRYFTTINDFLAFSIPLADLKKFIPAVNLLKDRAESVGGTIEIRKESKKDHWQSVNEKSIFLDIVQFVQVYLPKVGLVEIQVIHPFAWYYTFKLDSKLRQNPQFNEFYTYVKNFIVDKANNRLSVDQLDQCKNKIMQEAKELHNKFHMPNPEVLNEILSDL